MPHVNIKYFPKPLDEQQRARLVTKITEAVREALGVEEGVISIALQPVASDAWDAEVYTPEIIGRKDLLAKLPDY
ncbi:tautomerase family protein [Streptomyces sp. NPDC059168]|uniref:tautomerase family protein n=1 Tax=Streptomyces sp. NPDC059168 TaxID=3346753 RepID=UPI0036A92546